MHLMYQLPQDKGLELYQGDIIDREALIKEGGSNLSIDRLPETRDSCFG